MKARTIAIGSVLGILLCVSPLALSQQRDDVFLMPGQAGAVDGNKNFAGHTNLLSKHAPAQRSTLP